jgi:hypothetical protein
VAAGGGIGLSQPGSFVFRFSRPCSHADPPAHASPYTGRFDATRAGLGIALELHRIAREHQLTLRIGFRALPMQEIRALFAP